MGTLGSLQNSRNARRQAQDLAWQNAVRLASESKKQQETQAETLASGAYVNKKQQERVLPNVMQKAGLNTQGYTETTANNIGTAYTKSWTDIMNKKQENVAGIDSDLATTQNTIGQNKANIEGDYQQSLAAYYQSLQKPSGSTTKDKAGVTAQTLIPDSEKKSTEDIIMTLTGIYTDPKYQKMFWGSFPGFSGMTSEIRAIAQTIKSKTGGLTSLEIDDLIRAISNHWINQSVVQRQNPGGGTTNLGNPPMQAIPGVSPNNKKVIKTGI